jgi:predicted AAA+ superfamily ATPase
MIRNVILQQKEEKELLAGIPYQPRLFPRIPADFLTSGLIKLITGPRRSGKSVFALQFLKDQNYAYLNFDDDKLLKTFQEDEVTKVLQEVYPGYTHLFLDEIQNLSGWELWVNKLHRRGVNLIITGSNARLLSKEMATFLTGRYLLIEILPFSFAEFLNFYKMEIPDETSLTPLTAGQIIQFMNDYLLMGGFPETLQARSITKNYLSSLFDSILLKDVANRFQIRQPRKLYELSQYLLSNYCNLFTFTQLTQSLDFNSVTTLQKYTGFLSEPYLFFYLPRYMQKVKSQQKSAQKGYVVDTGFVYAKSFELSQNRGRLLENLVFIELIRRNFKPGLDLFYYRTNNDREVDFICRKGHQIVQLVQVCFDLSDPKTFKREMSALVEAAKELSCDDLLILTWDQEFSREENGYTASIRPVWKWLLDESPEFSARGQRF